jgi:hypothetical protein
MITLELIRGWGLLKEPVGYGSFIFIQRSSIMRKFTFTILCVFIFQVLIFSQEISGKIISSDEALNLFGEAEKSYKIEASLLKSFIESSEYLYFNFNSSKPVITTRNKEVLYPSGIHLNGQEVFHVYSSSIVNELLNLTEDKFVIIEKRKNVLTISSGSYTLEYALLCPPYCF